MSSRFSKKQKTSEKRKARQYGAAALFCVLVVIIMTVVRLIWGNVEVGSKGDKVSLGEVIFYVRGFVLLLGAADLVSAICHFMIWNRNGRPDMEDDNDSLFSDWKSGERSPVKVSLILTAGIVVLALVTVIQG